MDNLTNSDHYELKVKISDETEMTQVMNAITNVHKMIQRTTKEPKLVQTQVSIFKGQKYRYNDFELLPLNHTQLFQHKMTEEQKLLLFEKLLREDDIELWQKLTLTSDQSFLELLRTFRKEYSENEFEEVSSYRWDQLRNDSPLNLFLVPEATQENIETSTLLESRQVCQYFPFRQATCWQPE